jgi:hypothetical protein
LTIDQRILVVPEIRRNLVYGKRHCGSGYWWGSFQLIPGQQEIVTLWNGYNKPRIFGTEIGFVEDFGCDGAFLWYGMDGNLYYRPELGRDWGVAEGNWRMFKVMQGGFHFRDLAADIVLDPTLHLNSEFYRKRPHLPRSLRI